MLFAEAEIVALERMDPAAAAFVRKKQAEQARADAWIAAGNQWVTVTDEWIRAQPNLDPDGQENLRSLLRQCKSPAVTIKLSLARYIGDIHYPANKDDGGGK